MDVHVESMLIVQPPLLCRVDAPVKSIISSLAQQREHIALVMNADCPIGVISLRDIVELALAKQE